MSLGQPVPGLPVGVARVSGRTVEQPNLGDEEIGPSQWNILNEVLGAGMVAKGLDTLPMFPEKS